MCYPPCLLSELCDFVSGLSQNGYGGNGNMHAKIRFPVARLGILERYLGRRQAHQGHMYRKCMLMHGRIQPVYILQYNRGYRHTTGYTTGWYLRYNRTTGTVVRDTNLMVLTIVPVVRLYHKYQPVV